MYTELLILKLDMVYRGKSRDQIKPLFDTKTNPLATGTGVAAAK